MDLRRNYKRNKITVIELYIKFKHLSVGEVAYKLGYNKQQLQRIVNEWERNDGFIVVESKMNSL